MKKEVTRYWTYADHSHRCDTKHWHKGDPLIVVMEKFVDEHGNRTGRWYFDGKANAQERFKLDFIVMHNQS